MQFLLCLVYPLSILAVHDKDEALCSGVIVSPQRPNLVLAANVPHVELDILIRHRFDVETDCSKARA